MEHFKKVILFAGIFLLAGCASAEKKLSSPSQSPILTQPVAPDSKKLPEKIVTSGVTVFKDIRQIDLDNDGEKEIVGIFTTAGNSGGVKVIKSSRGEANSVIFEKIFPTPNIKFTVRNGDYIIIAEDFDLKRKRLVKRTYRWDGAAFALES